MIVENGKEYFLDLANNSLIIPIWNNQRMISSLYGIGSNSILPYSNSKINNFEYQKTNHFVEYMFPIGALVLNGNHSIFSGRTKREGVVRITSLKNISKFYEKAIYDGVHLIEKNDNQEDNIIIREIKFELGVLFEIGKIFMENKGIFAGHPLESMFKEYDLI